MRILIGFLVISGAFLVHFVLALFQSLIHSISGDIPGPGHIVLSSWEVTRTQGRSWRIQEPPVVPFVPFVLHDASCFHRKLT